MECQFCGSLACEWDGPEQLGCMDCGWEVPDRDYRRDSSIFDADSRRSIVTAMYELGDVFREAERFVIALTLFRA